ncbi:MAG: threonine ammonia-lyase, biosynthetic [Candidatus Binataceae bacterium]
MDCHTILTRALNARVAEVLPEPTPLDDARRLSERLGTPVLLKREDLTPIFSFKLRGAYNRMALLDDAQKARGVIAASGGNHAQGVAYSAARLGIQARVVMPKTTPEIKVEAVRCHGARVDLIGDDYSEAAAYCTELAAATGMIEIPAYDDLDVIAGQATIALEILRQATPDLGSIFVPVGGGGLAAGIAAVIKAVRPRIRVFGVEPDDSDAMTRSIRAGRRVALDQVGIFADGVAVRMVGENTFALCRDYLDDCVTVSIDEICAGVKDAFEDTRAVLEPAGALSIAGLKRLAREGRIPAGPAIAIASGANVNFNRLAFAAERAALGEHREAMFAVTIPERRGAFLDFCRVIGDRNITEFNYRLATRDEAHIFVGVEISGRAEAEEIARLLHERGYRCHDLTGNELAKSHVRHMVGGRSGGAIDEVLYSFSFPDRPGAFLRFLTMLGDHWNISLFHYRNQGGAYGRILCGFETRGCDRRELRARFNAMGVAYTEETDNPAAAFFLR